MSTQTVELLTLPDVSTEAQEGSAQLEAAKALEVIDAATFAMAGEMLKGVSGLRRRIEGHYAPVIDAAHRSHKAALAARDMHTKPLGDIEVVLKRKAGDYQSRERARIEAEQRAEAERVRIENNRILAEQAKKRRDEEDARLAAASALESNGEVARAAAVLEAPMPAVEMPQFVVPAPVAQAPKIAGVSFSEKWSAEVVDKAAFVQWVADANQLALVDVNTSALNGIARNQKGAAKIPGVRFFSESVTTVRG